VRDSHVVSLTYELKTPSGMPYESPPAVDISRDEFDGRLDQRQFIATMQKHYATQDEAR
jgi:hypothetical protein